MLNDGHTQGRKEGTVDFHGLYVHEAVRYAKQELESASQRDDEVVRFIVGTSINELSSVHILNGVWMNSPDPGKGLHAENGEAKIRPALEKLCNEYVIILRRHIHCSVDSPRLISDMD